MGWFFASREFAIFTTGRGNFRVILPDKIHYWNYSAVVGAAVALTFLFVCLPFFFHALAVTPGNEVSKFATKLSRSTESDSVLNVTVTVLA